MNVIFLDFDGVIDTNYYKTNEDIEKKIAILAEICKEYNCKVVIDASAKSVIDEETLKVDKDAKWVQYVFDLFEKYGIECIGRTPSVSRRLSSCSYTPIWKEDEIRLYLFRHPEIEHYCVIDDDDLNVRQKSDLDKVRDHLVVTDYYLGDNPRGEGLLKKHKEQIKKVLEKENEVKRFALKKKVK